MLKNAKDLVERTAFVNGEEQWAGMISILFGHFQKSHDGAASMRICSQPPPQPFALTVRHADIF